MLELTYLKPEIDRASKRVYYTHQQINIRPSSVKWMRNLNKEVVSRVLVRKENENYSTEELLSSVHTEIMVDGMSTPILVKEKRIDIKKELQT